MCIYIEIIYISGNLVTNNFIKNGQNLFCSFCTGEIEDSVKEIETTSFLYRLFTVLSILSSSQSSKD